MCLFTRGRLPIPVPAGNTKTQFLYIDDLMNIFDHLMYKDRCVGQAFNVTNPEMISWHQWAENAMDALGKHVPVKAVPYIGKMNPREFFPFRDCTYLLGIKKLIDYQIPLPSTDLAKGLEFDLSLSKTKSDLLLRSKDESSGRSLVAINDIRHI